MAQHQTAAADPPEASGNEKVVMIVENKPLILTANEKVARLPQISTACRKTGTSELSQCP